MEKYRLHASVFAISLDDADFETWLKYINQVRDSVVADSLRKLVRTNDQPKGYGEDMWGGKGV